MVKIDEEKCIGCGKCINVHPGIFEMMDTTVRLNDFSQDDKEQIKIAAEICPVKAIILDDE